MAARKETEKPSARFCCVVTYARANTNVLCARLKPIVITGNMLKGKLEECCKRRQGSAYDPASTGVDDASTFRKMEDGANDKRGEII